MTSEMWLLKDNISHNVSINIFRVIWRETSFVVKDQLRKVTGLRMVRDKNELSIECEDTDVGRWFSMQIVLRDQLHEESI